MGLITKEVEISWTKRMRGYYKDKGYKYTKLGDKFITKVEDLTKRSAEKVEVICDCENCTNKKIKKITWGNYLRYSRNGTYYCNKCAGIIFGIRKMAIKRIEKSTTFEQWCLDNNEIDILNRWDYNLNNCLPSEVGYRTNVKYYFKCPKGEHESELKIINSYTKTKSKNPTGMECIKCNSFAKWAIDNICENFIDDYWCFDKNIISPWEIKPQYNKKIWLKCQEGIHEPFQITGNKFNNRHMCPRCSMERMESFLQEKVRKYLNELNFKTLHEYNCNIKPRNPKTNFILPYDNEVPELNLIIEVHGNQHYMLCKFHNMMSTRRCTTPEFEFKWIKIKDRYKRIYAKSNGYNYLEIPYWTDNKSNDWKELIDKKIFEIKNI